MGKRILSYKLFEERVTTELTQEQVEWLNQCAKETWGLNPATGLVDIDGNFRCDGQDLTDFKGVRFGTIRRNFSCGYNQLTSLEGAPKEVGGDFDCRDNQLASLEGAPEKVGGDFSCNHNQLTSLNGAPEKVGEDFFCHNNQLTSLEGAPKSVGGDFFCHENQLASLEGAPKEVGGYFDCNGNNLTSLMGAPKKVGEDFSCRYNQLTSLDGAPEKIGGTLYCSDNPVGYETLLAIYDLMKSGRSYPEALSQYWNQMPEEDKILMYEDNPDLSSDEKRGYELKIRSAKRIY
jgi:hypothetical protein